MSKNKKFFETLASKAFKKIVDLKNLSVSMCNIDLPFVDMPPVYFNFSARMWVELKMEGDVSDVLVNAEPKMWKSICNNIRSTSKSDGFIVALPVDAKGAFPFMESPSDDTPQEEFSAQALEELSVQTLDKGACVALFIYSSKHKEGVCIVKSVNDTPLSVEIMPSIMSSDFINLIYP